MEPADADAYFGKVLRDAPSGGRSTRSQALTSKAWPMPLRAVRIQNHYVA
ncbi:hypothetical protein [Streptomyces sp. NBC_01579]